MLTFQRANADLRDDDLAIELHATAVSICEEFTHKDPVYRQYFTDYYLSMVCSMLNDACFLHAEICKPRPGAVAPPDVLRTAEWWVSTVLDFGRTYLAIMRNHLPHEECESPLLIHAVKRADSVRKFIFQAPVRVDYLPKTREERRVTVVCINHQIACERYLQAVIAHQRHSSVESLLWEKSVVRGRDVGASPTGPADKLLRAIGDQLAKCAAEEMKNRTSVEQLGAFALHETDEGDEADLLAPYRDRIKTIARATRDHLEAQQQALYYKKRSAPWTLQTRAAAQFLNVAEYTRTGVEFDLGLRASSDDYDLLAPVAAQSAKCIVRAAKLANVTSGFDRKAKDDIVHLYKTAADMTETNVYCSEPSPKNPAPLSPSDEAVLAVAAAAGRRFAKAALARAQGNIKLRNAWMMAADATAALVCDREPRRAHKHRVRAFTADFTPEELARADALAVLAANMELELEDSRRTGVHSTPGASMAAQQEVQERENGSAAEEMKDTDDPAAGDSERVVGDVRRASRRDGSDESGIVAESSQSASRSTGASSSKRGAEGKKSSRRSALGRRREAARRRGRSDRRSRE